MVGGFPQEDQTDVVVTIDATEIGGQIETLPTYAKGTSNALPPVQSIPPRSRGMPPCMMMNSQAVWIEVVTQLATLTTKVTNMEDRVQNWIKWYLKVQDRTYKSTSMNLS